MNQPLIAVALLAVLPATALAASAPAPNPQDFGAKPDASADATPAIQRALDEAAKTGSRVYLPPGRYLLKGHLSIPDFVTLEGAAQTPQELLNATGLLEDQKGTILLAYENKGKPDGDPLIYLHHCSHLSGVTVFYPEQTFPIVEYPWTVRGRGDNCTITSVLLVNPYRAVDFGTQPCGRHYINGLYAHALKEGLFIDKCFDVGRVENVHFWPFWKDDKTIEAWQQQNSTAFRIARTDWEYMSNCFAIFYATGYHFVGLKDGPGNAVLTNCGSDISPCSVRVDATQGHAGVSFVNGQFMAGVVVADTNDGPVKFTNCGFWGYGQTDSHLVSHSKGNVSFTNCHFVSWDQRNNGAPCLTADNGGLTVNACEFLETDPSKTHVKLGGNLDSAIITSNRFRSPPKIVNNSNADAAIGMNAGPSKHR